MKAPTTAQLTRMQWARKAVHPDGTTRGGFRWPVGVGGWVAQDGPADGEPCGVGLHLGKTAHGLSSVHRLAESVLLVAGYLPDDVLGEDDDKVRVLRCWIMPGMTAGMAQVLRNGWGVGAYLTGADLTGANLTRANLTGANLTGANLTRADLTRAYLTGADLTRANLTRADLTRADLTRANLTRANLTRANLTGANLTGANLTYADLTRAYLTGADLTRANLTRAYLTGADLTGADLTRANLTRANLTGANLTGAYLTGAYLTGARVAWGPYERPSWLPDQWTVNDAGLIREAQP